MKERKIHKQNKKYILLEIYTNIHHSFSQIGFANLMYHSFAKLEFVQTLSTLPFLETAHLRGMIRKITRSDFERVINRPLMSVRIMTRNLHIVICDNILVSVEHMCNLLFNKHILLVYLFLRKISKRLKSICNRISRRNCN